jgi:hypothetical protein
LSILTPGFNKKLMERIERNADSVPFEIRVIKDGAYRATITAPEKTGIKSTVSMKRDIEKLTGENSVEIIY